MTVDTSWDELFSLVAPSATDWTRESTVRAALIRGLKNKAAPSTDGHYPDHGMTGATISAETFNTVMVQFLALGLFESKYESVKSGYQTKEVKMWTLTPYGQRHLFTVVARRREE